MPQFSLGCKIPGVLKGCAIGCLFSLCIANTFKGCLDAWDQCYPIHDNDVRNTQKYAVLPN